MNCGNLARALLCSKLELFCTVDHVVRTGVRRVATFVKQTLDSYFIIQLKKRKS